MKKKNFLLIILAVLLISVSSYAIYFHVNINSDAYRNDYTFDEINEKIRKIQKQMVSKIEKEYRDSLKKSEKRRIGGNMGINIKADSSFGGGTGSFGFDNIDLQYTTKGVDIMLEELILEGSIEMLGKTNSGELSIKKGHLISNTSGSYLLGSGIESNFDNLGDISLPEEIIMTLNKLGESGKYINLSENFLYRMLETQISGQHYNGQRGIDFMFDFLKNENVFIVDRQEETKYHLVLSPAICKLTTAIADIKDIFFTYEDFKNLENCTDQQYDKIKNDLKEFVRDSEPWKKNDLYIEFSKTKVHIYTNFDYIEDYGVKGKDQTFTFIYDGIYSIFGEDRSIFQVKMGPGLFTGSGILLSQENDTVHGYLDMDFTEENGNIFDSNINLSGTDYNLTLTGTYLLKTQERIVGGIGRGAGNLKISGEIKGKIIEDSYEFKMKNNFFETSGNAEGESTLNISGTYLEGKNIGNMNLNGSVQIGENTSPMSGTITANWDTFQNNSEAKGDISYKLDIPNIASGEYVIDYDFKISDIVESGFEKPENLIPQKNLETLLMINKKKVNAEKEKNRIQFQN